MPCPRNEQEAMRCPTCGAVQTWSESCRRCKSDLSLLRETAETYWLARASCLAAIRSERYVEALEHAREACRLSPGPEPLRLVAVCSLLTGAWFDAVRTASEVIRCDDTRGMPERSNALGVF